MNVSKAFEKEEKCLKDFKNLADAQGRVGEWIR